MEIYHFFYRWKDACNELTDKFQNEILHLRAENTQLITENQRLKNKFKHI